MAKKVPLSKVKNAESKEDKPFFYYFGPTKIHIMAKTQQEADHILSGMKLLKDKFKKKKDL